MKKTITTLALASAMLFAAAAPAFATHPEPPPASDNQPANDECRPGADNNHIGPWELMDKDGFLAAVNDAFPTEDPERLADRQRRTDATWDFCDHNGDELLCVFKSTLPSGTSWLLLDNRPFGGNG